MPPPVGLPRCLPAGSIATPKSNFALFRTLVRLPVVVHIIATFFSKKSFGVAMLPAGKQRGSPTGGGNFYLFKKSTPAQRDAAFKFIKWITTPARAAQWGIDTGYVAVRADAWDTPAMKQYVAGFPAAAVARDQLPFAKAELSTHDNQRVTKALNDGLQAALTGTKTPEQAMKDAQREAERLLRSFK